MPTQSRKTPQRTATMLELHGRGASAREIGEALKLTHHTIVAWLKDAGLKPNGGQGLRKVRRRDPPAGAAAVLSAAQKALADLAVAPAPTDLAGVLTRLRENYGLVCALVEYHVKGARAGTSTMGELDKAISIQERYAVKIAELTPREEPDPENDPTSIVAATSVRQELERLVARAEKNLRCLHCGRHPFASGDA